MWSPWALPHDEKQALPRLELYLLKEVTFEDSRGWVHDKYWKGLKTGYEYYIPAAKEETRASGRWYSDTVEQEKKEKKKEEITKQMMLQA